MTLDEAIKHAREIADNKKCTECGENHRQLADWLEELKYYREECETFKVKKIIQPLKPINTVTGNVRIVEKPKKIFE